MATAVNQQASSCPSLQPLVVCPGHESIDSLHASRNQAKEKGFQWLKEQHKENHLIDCSFDVRKDIEKIHALILSYRHQDLENCPTPYVILPVEHTACFGHKQVVKTYEVYKDAKKAGFKWLEEKEKDASYIDCKIEIPEDGKKYSLVYSYKHQNLDPSSSPYLRFPCQFLACIGHPHIHSVHSTEKKAVKVGDKWLEENVGDKNCTDFQKVILKGPKKNHVLVCNFKHHNIDTCSKPRPVFSEFLNCPGHSFIYKTYDTREKAKQVGTKWLHEKQKDSYYQNSSFDVDDVASKVHNLVCYFEHQNIDGCLNARTAFDHFVENDHPNFFDKVNEAFERNRKIITIAFVIAGVTAAATKEIITARQANDFFIRNVANAINPSPLLSAHPKPISTSFSAIEKPQEQDLCSTSDPLLSLSSVDNSHSLPQPAYPHFQDLVSQADVVCPNSMPTLSQASQSDTSFQESQSGVVNKLNTHFYQPLKNNIAYALGHPLFQGTLQAIGGAAEMALGAGLTLKTFGAGLPIGGALMYHGYDHLMAGLKTAFTRQPAQTTTTYLLQKIGLSYSKAVFIDDLAGTIGSLGVVGWLRATPVKLITNTSKLKAAGVFQANQKVIVAGQEIGLSTREMFKLKEAGKLNGPLYQVYENIFPSVAARESFELFQKAEKTLKPYTKIPMSEVQIRELIQSTGVKTYPRPVGIPQNFLVQISEGGAGIEYIHPLNKHYRIRVMPGKPHSKLPFQQKPYIKFLKDGMALDLNGNFVSPRTAESHIPYDEFIFRD